MDMFVFLTAVIYCSSVADTVSIYEFTKGNEKEPLVSSTVKIINRLKRKVPNTVEMSAFGNVKSRPSMTHRKKRAIDEWVKTSRDFTKELSREKRFKELNADIHPSVKRLKRYLPQINPDFAHVRHYRSSMAFTLAERLKRRNNRHLKRLKRTIVASTANLMRNKRSKRIPPDVHKIKKIKDKRRIHQMLRALDDRKRSFRKRTKSKKHFQKLNGKPYNLQKNLPSIKQMNASKTPKHRQHRFRDIGTFEQRVQKRIRDRKNKYKQKRKWHNKMKVKKDEHHVKSHRLNKKNI